MDVHRLLGDELSYELALRGVPSDNRTVADKRTILRGLLRCERNGLSNTRVTDHLVVESELTTCNDKLSDLAEDIKQFDCHNAASEFRRINSRLLHIAGRLNQLTELSELQSTTKVYLVSVCMQLMGTVADLAEKPPQPDSLLDQPVPSALGNLLDDPNLLLPEVEHLTVAPALADLGNFDMRGSDQLPSDRPANVSGVAAATSPSRVRFTLPSHPTANSSVLPTIIGSRANVASDVPAATSPISRVRFPLSDQDGIPHPTTSSGVLPTITGNRGLSLPSYWEPSRHNASVPISKWNLSFDGNKSVTDFLDRVNELCESRHVSRQQLFQSAVELFVGDALVWFRAIRHSVRTWDELEASLKTNFLPYDYETKLWSEIRRRSQGAEEKVVVYIAVLENLFNKLPTKPSELERIRVIKNNLLPYFQPMLALADIRSLPELIKICRSLEEASHCAEQFRPPPPLNRFLLEPELAYRRPTVSRIAPLECPSEHQEISSQTGMTRGPLTHAISYTSTADSPTLMASPTSRSEIAAITCWNCRQTGHRSSECSKTKTRHCFRCGKPNFTVRTCPNCSGNATGNPQ